MALYDRGVETGAETSFSCEFKPPSPTPYLYIILKYRTPLVHIDVDQSETAGVSIFQLDLFVCGTHLISSPDTNITYFLERTGRGQ